MDPVNVGSLSTVIRLPVPWPPSSEITLLKRPHGDGTIELTALTDSRILFRTTNNLGRVIQDFKSQPIDVSGSGYTIMSLTWSAAEIKLRLDRRDVESDAQGVARFKLTLK